MFQINICFTIYARFEFRRRRYVLKVSCPWQWMSLKRGLEKGEWEIKMGGKSGQRSFEVIFE